MSLGIYFSTLNEGPFKDHVVMFDDVSRVLKLAGTFTDKARQIATTEQCAACHVRLGLHGGPRRSVEYCVTCHNPGTVDPDGDESVEMSYMVHSIHMGRERPLAYIVYGYGGSVHDYSDVGYPQSPLYCENCHAAGIGAEGGVWDSTANTAQNHLKGDKLARVVAETSFRYEIISATETGPGQFPVVTFAVNDPSLGSRYDISTDPQFTSAGASLLSSG